jgi:hypothetical protein
MKLKEINFRQPVKILTIFRNINIYGKSKKSFDDRKEEFAWHEIFSKSGYIKGNELYLPEHVSDATNLAACGLITIEDNNHKQAFHTTDLQHTMVIASNKTPERNRCLNLNHPNRLDIFDIKFKSEIEIFLHYDYFEVGIPERDHFKICSLKMHQPVEIKINGKTDSSMSSGRERIFKEQSYILEYAGDFSGCKLLKEPYDGITKHIPSERKIIDLMKPLW